MIARIFLALNAIAMGVVGIFYLYDPDILLARYDVVAGSVSMDNMLRASYGGVSLGAALIFTIGVFNTQRRRDILAFTAIFIGGFAVGRVASLVFSGPPHSAIYGLLGYEVVMGVLGIVLFLRASR
jgi:hypothetical protein